MKKQIKAALNFHKYICNQDPANTVRYTNALVVTIKRITK